MTFIGIDVSATRLDWATEHESGQSDSNNKAGIGRLVSAIVAREPTLVVLEATGRYHHDVTVALTQAAVAVAVVNPRHVRDFARSVGQLAKTDRLDAAVLARFAAAVQPVPRTLPTADRVYLAELIDRRHQLVTTATAEKNRVLVSSAALRSSVESHLDWLRNEIERIEREMSDWIE